ncbi:MAG: hypothetical protein IH933_06090, partial [Euryarchaeota archaeon]|nr:hypothetical protein [Euryarchaeota archaeon]
MIVVATEDFELYHGVVGELRERGVEFTTVEPGEELPERTRIRITGPGESPAEGVLVSGWYSAGESLVLRAKPHIYDDAGRSRLAFEEWEMIHGP